MNVDFAAKATDSPAPAPEPETEPKPAAADLNIFTTNQWNFFFIRIFADLLTSAFLAKYNEMLSPVEPEEPESDEDAE